MIVARNPILPRAGGPVLQMQGHAARLAGFEVELLLRGYVEHPAVRLDSIVSLGQIVSAAPLQQNEVRLLGASDFQRIGRKAAGPQALTVEEIDVQRQYGLHRAEAKGPSVL